MKKILLTGLVISIALSANAVVNMPDSAPIYNAPRRQQSYTPSSSSSASTSVSSNSGSSASVASMARQLARNMHYKDDNSPELQIKMQENGVEGMEVIGRLPCPRTGKIVPIKLGNKTYTGRKKCTVIRYLYKGQEYSEGVCE